MLTGDVTSPGALGAVCWSTLLKIISTVPSRRITERIKLEIEPALKEAVGGSFVGAVLSGGVSGALAVIPLYPLGTMGLKVTAGLQLGTGSWSTSFAGGSVVLGLVARNLLALAPAHATYVNQSCSRSTTPPTDLLCYVAYA
jgi:hypothetical protein